MKMQFLLTLATFITFIIPVKAQLPKQILQSQPQNLQNITIPQDAAVIVYFPAGATVDVGQRQDFPLTVFLARPIHDYQGNVIVPENSLVTIILKPTDGGAKIIAQSVVVRGRIVPIRASSQMIPGTTITRKRANEKAVENGSVWGRIGGSTLSFINGGDPEQFDRGAMLGSAIGLISGLRSPENTRVVQIPQRSIYVLSLEAPFRLSTR
jgi:hypothetical protein